MADEGGEKSHDPTPKRLQDAREKGQVAKSQDLAAALILLFAIILLMTWGRSMAEQFCDYTRAMLSEPIFIIPENEGLDGLRQSVQAWLFESIMKFITSMSVFFLSLMIIAVLVNLAQIGFLWLPDKLAFDFTRLDPIKGFGRIFSMQSVMRLLMGIGKIIICAVVAYYAVSGEIGTILNLTAEDERQIASYLTWTLLLIALKVAIALVILAILDLMYQKWKFSQDMKMSTEELKEEMKNTMGDPQVIGKRRQMQRELAMKQRQGSVTGTGDADVVVTNPTHLAVALKYDMETMDFPVVVAKGADFLAKQIRKIAMENGIPIVEKKPLARALYKDYEIGQQVTDQSLYADMAEVIAFAHKAARRRRSG